MIIELNNSYSKVVGLNTQQFRKLKSFLSYEVNPGSARFSGGFVKRKSLLEKDGSFPTGLIGKVHKFLTINNTIPVIDDKRLKPKPGTPVSDYPKGIKPYQSQRIAAQAAIDDERGGLVMPTGSGKSLVIALIALKLNLKTLVVVPSLNIQKQLIEALNTFMGPHSKNVTVLNIDSSKLQKPDNYDVLIIDECHHAAAKTYQDLNRNAWNNIYYRFFLTATWGRNAENEQLLFEGIVRDISYELSYEDAVSFKYIVPVEAYYIEVPMSYTEVRTWNKMYNELVVNNIKRNQIISYLMLQLSHEQKSCLCLVKEIAHGNILSEMSGIEFANGQDGASSGLIESFNKKDINLIATSGVCGEGVDTKPAEYVIIAGLGKARSQFMQAVGRAVRTYPGKESAKIIILKDKSHKWTLSHFNTEKKILLEEYGVKVQKLEI